MSQLSTLAQALASPIIISSHQDRVDENLVCYLPTTYKTYDEYMRAKRSRLTGLLQCGLVSTVSFVQGLTTRGILTGLLVNVGGGTITEVGMVYSTNQNPTTADTKVAGTLIQNGTFTVDTITGTGLRYARAYVTNTVDTFYGAVLSLTVT
jgi:hypothetical protein